MITWYTNISSSKAWVTDIVCYYLVRSQVTSFMRLGINFPVAIIFTVISSCFCNRISPSVVSRTVFLRQCFDEQNFSVNYWPCAVIIYKMRLICVKTHHVQFTLNKIDALILLEKITLHWRIRENVNTYLLIICWRLWKQ